MKVAARQLASHLRSKLSPSYLVSGDEPLAVTEALGEIRTAARERQFTERELYVVDRGFRWGELGARSDNLSLFASRKIIELRLSSPRPGEVGGRVIRELVENPDPDRLLVVGIMAKLDAAATRSQWVKSVEAHGVRVDVWPVDRAELPKWIRGRARGAGIELTPDAAELLADRVEGNLLAADQEIAKLALVAREGPVGEREVLEAVAESARFDVFRLTDAVLACSAPRALRILAGLRSEGAEPALVSWALVREITLLARLATARGGERDIDGMLARQGVWRRRQPQVKAALKRRTAGELKALLRLAAEVDEVVKGARRGSPWDALTTLVIATLGLAHSRDLPYPHGSRATG